MLTRLSACVEDIPREEHPMASPRSRSYEYRILALLVLFWGTVGLNRVGIGF